MAILPPVTYINHQTLSFLPRQVISCTWKKGLSFSFQIPVPEKWKVFHVDREKSVTLTAIPKDQRLANPTEKITAHAALSRSVTVESYFRKLNTELSVSGRKITKIEHLSKSGGYILKDEFIDKKRTETSVQAIIKTHGVFFILKYSTDIEKDDQICANYLPMLRDIIINSNNREKLAYFFNRRNAPYFFRLEYETNEHNSDSSIYLDMLRNAQIIDYPPSKT